MPRLSRLPLRETYNGEMHLINPPSSQQQRQPRRLPRDLHTSIPRLERLAATNREPRPLCPNGHGINLRRRRGDA